MEQGSKIHFFCPKQKIDIAVQTGNNSFFFLRNREKGSNIYDLFHDSCQDSILTQTLLHPITQIDSHFIGKIRSKVAFFVPILKDDRFDSLSLSDDSEDCQHTTESLRQNLSDSCDKVYSPEIYFEFKDTYFLISNLRADTSCKYSFSINSDHLFDPLETGFFEDHFISSIDNNIFESIRYENGYCICDVTDFRFEPQIHKQIKLRIDQKCIFNHLDSVLSSKSKLLSFITTNNKYRETNETKIDNDFDLTNINVTDEDLKDIKIETERQILIKFHPTICTDPSPDVARVQSIYDFRKKMWRQQDRCQNYIGFPPFSLTNSSQKAICSNEKDSSMVEFQPVKRAMAKVEKQIGLPKSIQQYFSNFDVTRQPIQNHQAPL